MRQRFTVDELGRLVDRDGNVLGKLVSLTLESPRAAGTIGVAVSSGEQQGLEGEQTPLAPSEPSMQDPIDVVWAHYVEVMKPRKRELDAQGRAVIREALKVATVEECCGAIDGCKASSFHMGQNEKRRKHNRLTNILKGATGQYRSRTTREQIDFFLDIAEKAGVRSGLQSGVTSADPAKISRCKQAVLDARTFPGDGLVVRRGEEAARWLRAEIGIEWDAAARRWRDVPRQGA
jgi:hypothetical protein